MSQLYSKQVRQLAIIFAIEDHEIRKLRLYAAFKVDAVIASAGDIFICVHARDRTIGMLGVGDDPGLKSVASTIASPVSIISRARG